MVRSHLCWLTSVLLAVSAGSAVPSSMRQDPLPQGIACNAGAVEVTIDRKPRAALVPMAAGPDLTLGSLPREFTFSAGPHREVRLYLTATLPESVVGMASEARLSMFVMTAASPGDLLTERARWWRLDPAPPSGAHERRTSERLVFDAKDVNACFGSGGEGEPKCEFAAVRLATEDAALPLISVGFRQDLGGANARNWTDATLLLDFRHDTPRVLASVDCDYNEGGGACTAIDSGEMPRTELDCRWAADAADFLCTESGTDGIETHRDFYLLTDRAAPLRPGELATLEDAFRAAPSAEPLIVRGVGPVSRVRRVDAPDGSSAQLLHAAGTFYLHPGDGSPLSAKPRPLLPLPEAFAVDDRFVSATTPGWTPVRAQHLDARTIHQRDGLTVLEVVEGWTPDQAPEASALYWVGVERSGGTWRLDVLQLFGGAEDDSCGDVRVPPTAVSVSGAGEAFRRVVAVRPSVLENAYTDDPNLRWVDEEDERGTCVRPATVVWRDHRFSVTPSGGPCAAAEPPPKVGLSHKGQLLRKR